MDSVDEGRAGAPAPRARSTGNDPAGLRHPLERNTTRIVVALDVVLVLTLLALLLVGAEWLERVPMVGRYATEAPLILLAVFAGPIMATYTRRRRRMLAQEESIRVSTTQLPEVYERLVAHCTKVGIPVPELYLSEAVARTTRFASEGHTCIILSTDELAIHQESFEDVIDFTLAREVGAICLGYTSLAQELLASFIGPFPFLRAPLSHMHTYSCDRYGAYLAPGALPALICEATGERLRNNVDPIEYFTEVERARRSGFWALVVPMIRLKLPLTYRIRELRRAGLLKYERDNGPAMPKIGGKVERRPRSDTGR
jgi:hypothetical protein